MTVADDFDPNEQGIPVDPGSLPIEGVVLDESLIYAGALKRATVAPKLSKGGLMFCGITCEVMEGDYEGVSVSMNYLPLPIPLGNNPNAAQKVQAQQASFMFGRFAIAYKLKGTMPRVSLANAESLARWQDWMSQFYNNIGKFTVQNQAFPEGSTTMRSNIRDFIIV